MVAFDWRPWKPLGALEDEAVDGWCGLFHDVLGADEIADVLVMAFCRIVGLRLCGRSFGFC